MMQENYQTTVICQFIMISIGIFLLSISTYGCTYSITMVHTEGIASDVVDETATNTPSTSVVVPLSPTP